LKKNKIISQKLLVKRIKGFIFAPAKEMTVGYFLKARSSLKELRN